MSLLRTDTKNIQSRLASYCRTGKEVQLPGITIGRVFHYRRLVYNIIQDNLEAAYPIAYKYLEEDVWYAMVKDFFSNHACQSYQAWQIPGEFYQYVLENNFAEKHNLPFLNDLLRFEWEEMVIYNMEDQELPAFKKEGDSLNDYLVINPEFELLPLTYPVHLFNPLEIKEKNGQYYVLIYRDRETGRVQFMDLSVWFALVIEQIEKGQITLNELLNEAPNLFGQVNISELTQTTISFINDLIRKEFILGYKPGG